MKSDIKMRKIPVQKLRYILGLFTREELRTVARKMKINIGRNKVDTINNIIMSKNKNDYGVSVSVFRKLN